MLNHQHTESFLLLAFLSVTYSTALVRIESLRLAVTARNVPNLLNLWVFAGVLLLPPSQLVGLVAIAYAGEWPARRIVGQPPFRYAYSAGSLAAAAVAAGFTLHHHPYGARGVIVAALVFTGVNMGTVAAAMTAARHFKAMRMFLSVRAHVDEAVTIALGCALAGVMTWHATTALSALPALVVLHRDSLRETVRATRSFDRLTGLWTELAWKVQARQMLLDTTGHVALLIIDPEQTGLEATIGQSLGNGIRPVDLIGHYGTRQVALLMPVGPAVVGRQLARRIRAHLSDAGIPAAMGYATTDTGDLDGLLVAGLCDLMTRRHLTGVDSPW